LPRTDHFRYFAHQLKIDQAVGGIRRRLDDDETDAALGLGGFFSRLGGRLEHGAAIVSQIESDGAHAETGQRLFDERFGAAVQRLAHQYDIARANMSPNDGRYRRHAAGKHRCGLAFFPECQTIFQNLQIRIVEARVDQTGRLTSEKLAPPRGVVEKILAILRGLEDESRCQEDRWLQRAFRQARIKPITHHLGFGLEHVFAHFALMIRVVTHAAPKKLISWPAI
jgi:hypothetical protein